MRPIEYPVVPAAVALALLLAAGGCTHYRPRPLPDPADPPEPTDMNVVRVQAADFNHPALPAVVLDERDGLTPDEAAVLAVLVHPRLRAARDARALAAAQVLEAGLLPNPSLAYEIAAPVGSYAERTVDRFDLGLEMELQALVTRAARQQAARAHAASVDLAVAWQEWQAAGAARLALCDRALAGQRVAASRRVAELAEHLFEDTQRATDLGLKTEADLTGAAQTLRTARTGVLQAEADRDQASLALRRALGLEAGPDLGPPAGWMPEVAACPDPEALGETAVQQRLDLLALRAGYTSQEARVRAAVRAQFPQIGIGLVSGRETDTVKSTGVGVRLTLPFFDRNQGAIARERATRRQLRDGYAARLFVTRADIQRVHAALTAATRRLDALDETLAAQARRAATYRHAVAAQRLDVWARWRAELDLARSRLDRLDLQRSRVDLAVALEIASGRLGLITDGGGRPPEGVTP